MDRGQDFTIESRFADDKSGRVPELAADLVRLKLDLILAASTSAGLAAKRATTTIPLVMASSSDPVVSGLVASLARPGGNVTGMSSLAVGLNSKRLEVLKDAVPELARVGLLLRAGGSGTQELQMKELGPAAVALMLKIEEIKSTREPQALESAFQSAKQKRVGAMMNIGRPFYPERKWLAELAGNLPIEGLCRCGCFDVLRARRG